MLPPHRAWTTTLPPAVRGPTWALAAFFAACGSTTTGSGGPGDGGACTVDTDCDAPLACVLGVCQAPTCLPAEAPCPGDGAMPCCAPLACTDGRCVAPPDASPDPTPGAPALLLDRDTLDFGAVQLGDTGEQSLRVENAGDVDLHITEIVFDREARENSEFTLIHDVSLPVALTPGARILVTVRYTPVDPGTDAGELLLASDDAERPLVAIPLVTEVKGERVAALVADLTLAAIEVSTPPGAVTTVERIDFGAVAVGESAVATLHVVNAGTGNNALTLHEIRTEPRTSDHFALDLGRAPSAQAPVFLPVFSAASAGDPRASLRVTVRFAPRRAGPVDEALSIATSDAAHADLRIGLFGAGIVAQLVVTPDPLDLGPVFVGATARAILTLRNAGGLALTLTELAPEAPADTPFAFDGLPAAGSLPLALGPAATHEIAVTFAPAAALAYEAHLALASSDPDRPRHVVLIRGRGALPPRTSIEPPRVDFGLVRLGQQARELVTVANRGDAVLDVSSLAWRDGGADGAFGFAPESLPGIAPGGDLGLNVTFTPAGLAPVADVLVLATNDPAAARIELPVTGQGTNPVLCVEPGSIDFGVRARGVRHGPFPLTVTNCGAGPLTLDGLDVAPDGDPDFAVTSVPRLPRVMRGGEAMEVGVVFTPRPGLRRGEVVLTHDVPGEAEVRVPLRGEGGDCAAGLADLDGDPGDCEYECPVWPATREVCDGVDDDCDGSRDEDHGTGAACDGIGVCGAGVVECAGEDVTRCSTEPGGSRDQSGAEACDGLDNNCDAATDEDFPLGEACVGRGECGPGVIECAGLHGTRCSSDPGGSTDGARAERCDGRDDDCDGVIDEDFGVGLTCVAPGACGAGVVECADLVATRCSSGAGGSVDRSSPERCDGIDGDCDGATDEDFGVGAVCDGTGACGLGRVECASERTARCTTDAGASADESTPERCDAADNDCDGATDEDFAVGSACDGTGGCGAGVYECDPARQVRRCSTERGGSESQVLSEVCDGIDNDCDAATDEDFDLGAPCVGRGTCGGGVWECASRGERRCSTDPGGSDDRVRPEVCDGADNDCDGRADEDFVLGAACDGEGACGVGVRECAGPAVVRCSTEPGGRDDQSRAETCNALDDDCDGATDEDFAVGAPCEGVGVCGAGVYECGGALGARCSTDSGGSEHAGPRGGSAERCDGLDNDCDGAADEDFAVGTACDGAGRCGAGVRECIDANTSRCSTDPGGTADEARAEMCNALDDDCDGVTDEDLGVGLACDGVGACGAGLRECASGGTTRCSTDRGGTADGSGAEVCNGRDDNCDGSVDEGFAVGAPCEGVGACGAGVVECAGASGTRCSTDIGGSEHAGPRGGAPERCDGLDNDCDGAADEDFAVGASCDGAGACGAGVRECVGLAASRCSTDAGGSADESRAEACNATDDDCDGVVDEDFGVGLACDGVGACGAGFRECAGGGTTRCSTDRGGTADESSAEVCNARDDDCDALTDEDFAVGAPCEGAGTCGAGVYECGGPLGARCSTDIGGSEHGGPRGGAPERCDGLDNDCDGVDDEDFAVGAPCDGVGLCGAGVRECAGLAASRCSTDAGGSADESRAETCNAFDDDCDGAVDEDFGVGLACDGVGVCGSGLRECASEGTTRCSTDRGGTADQSGAEVCNGRDDDCDGGVDEDFAVGAPCEGVGACGAGVVECAGASGTRCSTDIGGSEHVGPRGGVPERCDGLDNDCDGVGDEDFAVGMPCDGAGACGAGVRECAGLAASRCSTDAGGSADESRVEACNAADDDCDGVVDEDFGVGLACDGVGACGTGIRECASGGTTRCSTDRGGTADESSAEVCNARDDDCDALTDEDFAVGAPCEGAGACGAGVYECGGPLGARCSTDIGGTGYAGPRGGASERCDGLDNDCDRETDEDFGIGTACDGVGLCGAGVRECAGLTASRCSTDVGGTADGSSAETCNAADDDCDGLRDEDFGVGTPCVGTGRCGAGVIECVSLGSTRCSTDPGGSGDASDSEACNGRDDDCDGVTDEDFAVGMPCEGEGTCGTGVRECEGPDRTVCSTDIGGSEHSGPRGGAPERCDGLDNDCDATTDEDFAVGTPCDGAGACGMGVRECLTLAVARCSTEAGGSADESRAETCNGVDDDCDGTTDEDFAIGTVCDGAGACGAGVRECAGGGGVSCSTDRGGSADESGAEVCNARDDDCDGLTDEDFGVGAPCEGVGVCAAGVYECGGPLGARCSTDIGGSEYAGPRGGSAERCDGLDNDCDGAVDEDFGAGTACEGAGACGAGIRECAGPGSSRCSSEPGGSADDSRAESCNGADDDCDGGTDEDFGTGVPCDGEGRCGSGTRECAGPGATRCSTEPGGSGDQSASEACEGGDDDCDGLTDEDFDVGLACDGVGACGAGVYECDGPARAVCSTDIGGSEHGGPRGGTSERCDGVDNDCDRGIDEDFAVGATCAGVGACGPGVHECDGAGGRRCSTHPGGSADGSGIESCNDVDDDCDGDTDEDFGVGAPCEGVGACGAGLRECLAPAVTGCSTDPGGSGYVVVAESCDGTDEDCNGDVDEEFGVGTVCDGVGECGAGLFECADVNASRCSTDIGGSEHGGPRGGVSEACNGRDDDCDAGTDEKWSDLGQTCAGQAITPAGRYECHAVGLFTQCDTLPGGSRSPAQASDTLCNGLDDDCDAATDEEFAPAACTGECGSGTTECRAGAPGCSTDPGGSTWNPAPEQDHCADGIDNDCDGRTDTADLDCGGVVCPVDAFEDGDDVCATTRPALAVTAVCDGFSCFATEVVQGVMGVEGDADWHVFYLDILLFGSSCLGFGGWAIDVRLTGMAVGENYDLTVLAGSCGATGVRRGTSQNAGNANEQVRLVINDTSACPMSLYVGVLNRNDGRAPTCGPYEIQLDVQ